MATPRDGTATVNDLRVHFLDWGGAASGLPLLLLHGSAQTAHSWDEVAPDLARDHHVIALDQRGHGDTDWAPEGTYSRQDFVEDVGAFLDHLGWPTATLMGLSMGGLNALAFTAERPERVRGLVMVDIAPRVERAGGEAIRSHLTMYDFASFEDAVNSAHQFNPRRSLENIRDRLQHAMRQTPEGRWVYKFDPAIVARFREDMEGLWTDVQRVRCPALLVRGSESPILAAESARRFRQECPGAAIAEVPGAGHSVMGDNPSGFLAAVRPFLERHGL
jgi:pimeloyl-ACP methyl ester carboxylesterase